MSKRSQPTSIWDNPFKGSPQQTAIRKYREYLLRSGELLIKLPELRGNVPTWENKRAGWHSGVLAEFAAMPDDEIGNLAEWAYIGGYDWLSGGLKPRPIEQQSRLL